MGDRSGLRSRLMLLAGLSPLLCAMPARAQASDPVFPTGGIGVFLGGALGEGGGFEWGFEGFGTHYFSQYFSCSTKPRRGIGPLMRLSFVNLSRFELTAAVHGGGDPFSERTFFAIDGEVGASVFMEKKKPVRFAPHTGVTLEYAIFNFYIRQAWSAAPAVSLGGGARYLPTYGEPGICIEGRAYRDGCGKPQPATLRRDAGFDRKSPAARRWSKRAVEECASVPAFLQLALELVDLGAPLDLVLRAVQAADEELGHTRAALHLAQQFGGAPVTLVPPEFRQRPGLARSQALERMAQEAWLDGCLNEGEAARVMAAEAEVTPLDAEARICRRIAQEEAGHAALAFDVLRWVEQEAPSAVRAAGARLV